MADIIERRVCAEIGGGFVLFLIGMRVNKPWKIWKWWPVVTAMPRMLAELAAQPARGLLYARSHFGLRTAMVVQYWRSFEDLEAYSRDREAAHLPAWRAFSQAIASNGDVGIWHETYLIKPGCYENIYNNMPAYGLGAAATLVDALGARQEARQRILAAQA